MVGLSGHKKDGARFFRRAPKFLALRKFVFILLTYRQIVIPHPYRNQSIEQAEPRAYYYSRGIRC